MRFGGELITFEPRDGFLIRWGWQVVLPATVAAMVKRGWLAEVNREQHTERVHIHYSITPAGREALAATETGEAS